MADELVGTLILSVDGKEFDCASFDPKESTGRKLVPTMNRSGRANKSAKTTASGAVDIEVVIPKSGDIDWAAVEDARVTGTSEDGEFRETWTGVGISEVGDKYSVGNEARRTLSGFYKDHIKE